jgi:phosphoribosylglycinamide formyltransferase-1
MKNIVILISGRGSNMEAIVRALASRALAGPYCRRHQQPRRCARPGFAAEHGIATAVVANKDYASRAEFDAALQT